MYQKLITNKLFYDKWPYKVTCNVQGITLLRSYSPEFIIEKLYEHRVIKNTDLPKLKEFLKLALGYINDNEIKQRIENQKITFYVLTKEKLFEIKDKLLKFLVSVSEPSCEYDLKKLQTTNNIIICKELPHKKYQYKITFKDMPEKTRLNLIKWAEKYNNDDIYITKSTRRHFNCIKFHYGSHYFYVKNKQMITFILMAAAGYIRRTDEFVLQELANTV